MSKFTKIASVAKIMNNVQRMSLRRLPNSALYYHSKDKRDSAAADTESGAEPINKLGILSNT